MPEIWLNYGINDVVLDIQAENFDEKISNNGSILEDMKLAEKLDTLDITKPLELVISNYSNNVQKVLTKIFEKCEEKSISKPKIFAEKRIINLIKAYNPEDSVISEFEANSLENSNLVFIGEMEFNGLFGFDTISTRLLKQFGNEKMLEAFSKRNGDLPCPGKEVPSIQVAKEFTDSFDISSIEIISNTDGLLDLEVGHPSKTMSIAKSFANSALKQTEKHRTFVVSTGKDSSNDSFSKSLNSIWNMYNSVKTDGLVILLAECKIGIGSGAIQQYIDDRITVERIKNSTKYIDGMENLLYLQEIQKNLHIGLVSILPEFYLKKLDIKLLDGIKNSLDYILKIQGPNQKVKVIEDGARVILEGKN